MHRDPPDEPRRGPRSASPAILLGTLLALASLAVTLGGGDVQAPPAAAAEGAPAGESKSPGLPYRAAEAAGGRIEVLPSGVAVLHLRGTPEEMGRQQGTLLREPIRHLVANYLPKLLRGDRATALAAARAFEGRIPERHRREMKAMAEAAGVAYDDALLGSVVVELLGLNMCSGLVAWGASFEGGGTVVGRNLEWPDHGMLGQYGLIVAARPEGHRAYLAFGFPAMTGVVTGLNADGVFTGELVVLRSVDGERAKRGIPYPILQRRIVEECGSLAEALALVKSSPLGVAQNLLLADPAGGAVVECAADMCNVRPALRDGLVVVTNHHGEHLAAPERDPRYARMCGLLKGAAPDGRLTEAEVEETVRAGGRMAGFINLQSGLFFPDTLRVRISMGRPAAASRPFQEVDGAALLGVEPPARRRAAATDAPGTGMPEAEESR